MNSETELIQMHPPEEIDADTVQYWCHHGRVLAKSQKSKAQKFVEYDCVRYIGGKGEYLERHAFICLPLNTESSCFHNAVYYPKIPYPTDYNFTVYEMFKRASDWLWTCNCQGWSAAFRKRQESKAPLNDGVLCSHLVALFYCFKMRKFSEKEGVTRAEAAPEYDDGKVDLIDE